MELLRSSPGARRPLAAVALVLAAALSVACGEGLAVPPSGPHVSGEPVAVPYPPPPAKVEIVEEPPPELQGRGVWIDGSWQWNSRRWEWTPGGWQEAIAGAYYARPTTVRRGDGTLVWFPGAWNYDPNQKKTAASAAPPPPLPEAKP